jgi:hypothetical protein
MMGRLVLLLFALATLVTGFSVQSAAQNASPLYTSLTLCKISFRNEKTNPKFVSLDLRYVNAHPHGMILFDRHCPGKGLEIDFPKTELDPSAAKLRDDLWLISEATGTFRGMLERDQRTGRLCLSVQSVLNFKPKYFYPEYKDKPLQLPEPEWPKWPPAL